MTRSTKANYIYNNESVLAIYDESESNNFVLVRCNSNVKEDEEYLEGVFVFENSTDKKLEFVYNAGCQENSFKTSRILYELGSSEVSITETFKVIAKSKGGKGKAKAQELESLTIALKSRTLTKLTKLAQKFVPVESESEQSSEESLEEEPAMVEEKVTETPKRVTKKIVGAKIKSCTNAPISNLSKRKADDLDEVKDFKTENTKAVKTEKTGKV